MFQRQLSHSEFSFVQVERHEGGGLSISGVVLSAHCHLTLIICGVFCLLAGILLTYVGYGTQYRDFVSHEVDKSDVKMNASGQHSSKPTAESLIGHTKAHPDGPAHHQLRIVGPICVFTGFLMIFVGLTLFMLGRKVRIIIS